MDAPSSAEVPQRESAQARLKRWFLTGLLVIVPAFITIWVLMGVLDFVDGFFAGIPETYRPQTYVPIPGVGAVITFVLVLGVGAFMSNVMGRYAYDAGDRAMSSIPVVRGLYKTVKQTLHTFVSSGQNFRKVVLIEYPRKGIYSIGFLTGAAQGEIQDFTHKRVLHVFVPTSPNPTSGFLLIVPDDEIVPLRMSVEDAFKVIISGGIVNPDNAGEDTLLGGITRRAPRKPAPAEPPKKDVA